MAESGTPPIILSVAYNHLVVILSYGTTAAIFITSPL